MKYYVTLLKDLTGLAQNGKVKDDLTMCNCIKCKCITCKNVDTCGYHRLCSADNGQTQGYVKECKDYIYSKENDEYINGRNRRDE